MSVLEFGYQFALVFLAAVAEHFKRVGLGDVGADNGFLAACQFQHFFLDTRKIFGCQLMFARVDVIIEAVFNGRTDTEFHAGVQFLKRLGQQVRRRVPESMLALGVVPFEKLQRGIALDGACEIPFLAVHRCGKDILGKARRYAAGNIKRRHAGLILLHAVIGKSNVYHRLIHCKLACNDVQMCHRAKIQLQS